MEHLKYPISHFDHEGDITDENIREWITEIENLPRLLRDAVQNLSDEQLDTPYRPDGWTVRQVIHHIADSHLNSFIRFKWALTENNPTIKAYFEDRWANLPDYHMVPIQNPA